MGYNVFALLLDSGALWSLETTSRSKARKLARLHNDAHDQAKAQGEIVYRRRAVALVCVQTKASRAAGGHARAAALTPARRRAIASKAARARWDK